MQQTSKGPRLLLNYFSQWPVLLSGQQKSPIKGAFKRVLNTF
jgi:hypothetical protein